jgi:hypothetical protein
MLFRTAERRGDQDDQHRHWQERRAGLDGGVPHDVLDEERVVEEDAKHREADEQHDHVRTRERPVLEEGEVEHGHPLAQLEQDEDEECDSRDCEEPDDPSRRPPVFVRLDERVGECEEPDPGGEEPRQVETLLGRRVPRLVDDEPGDDDRQDADGNVDEEDPVPADVLCDETADQRSDRQGQRGDARPDADRHPALPRREGGGDDRERGGVHEGRADALDDPRADQDLRATGQAAGERGAREDDEPDDEDAPPAEQVGQLPAREHEHAEGERVAVEHPLELGDPDAEVVLDRRQRHVHDRVVEHDHEEPECDGSQRPPLAVFLGEDPRPHRHLLEKVSKN